ncbi:MAG: thiol-disulfide isomerase [Acidobacteriia bacterium]|nr:thiol-disulfide isomerase [Terriglobia bacterium]
MNKLYSRLVWVAVVAFATPAFPATPTFSKDIAPILFNSCTECHRKGEAAPMQLMTYKEARPWAKAIRERVLSRAMPPWFADPAHGKFHNDRSLSQREIDTVTAWVDAGAPEGDRKLLPAPPQYVEGWSIGKPDLIVELTEEVSVPASGVIPYLYYTVDPGLTQDKWVQAAEVRPGNRAVVHHVIVSILEPGSNATGSSGQTRRPGLVGFAPGDQPMQLRPGIAKQLKAGSKLVFQMHYTPNGKAATDRTRAGVIFSKEPVRQAHRGGMIPNFMFRIPPGAPSHEVKSSWTAKQDVLLTGLMPHMHVRGKDFLYTAVYPDGKTEVLLNVPRYDFNWQLNYQLAEPKLLPKGTRIDCVAHFDNSPNNQFNPDPATEVKWGNQTWEEMMIGWFNYILPDENLLLSQTQNPATRQ